MRRKNPLLAIFMQLLITYKRNEIILFLEGYNRHSKILFYLSKNKGIVGFAAVREKPVDLMSDA